MDAHKNFAISAVVTVPSPAASGTTLVVTTGQGSRFPTVPFNAVVCPASTDPDPTNAEVVRVTNIATDTLTITRAQESSSARTITVGDRIYAAVTAKTLTDVEGLRLDQLAVPTADISLNGQKITNLGTPTASTDAVTKAYADAIAAGLDPHASVKVATTANITLSGTQTIDGVAVVAADRVLVKNQTTTSGNGLYAVAAGAWSRTTDADTGAELTGGSYTFVESGTTQAETGWVATHNGTPNLGTDPVTFSQFSGGGGISATVVDAKGDLIAATGSDAVARLAVGSNYQEVVADSAATSGLRWRNTAYIHAKDYCVGDGTTDDTTALQAAVDAAATSGRPLYIDPGLTYLINGQVVISTNFFRWIMPFGGFNDPTETGIGSKILCGNNSAPCLLFGNSAGMKGLYVHGLRVWAKSTASRFRIPMVQFGHGTPGTNNGLSDSHLYDLFADGRSVSTDAFLFHTVYNMGVYSPKTQNMSGGVSFVVKAANTNVGNMAFYNGAAYQGGVGWLIDEYNTPTNLINSIGLYNCKAVCNNAVHTFVVGTLTGAQSIGNSSIAVSSSTGFAAGQWVTLVKSDSRVYVDKVASVPDSTHVALTGTIPFTMAASDTIVAGNWHTVTGGQPLASLICDLAHWENCNGALISGLDGGIWRLPHLTNGVYRGLYLARSATQITLDGLQCATGTTIPANAVMFHQADDGANNARNRIRNTCISDWHAGSATNPKMIQIDGTNATQVTAYNERFGGIPAMLGVWHQDTTVAASQTNVQLTGPQNSASRSVRLPHYGAVVGIQVVASTARSAGTLTATLFKNGSATALTAVLDATNTTAKTTEYENTTVTVAPNDRLDVRVTTDGTWAPTSNNIDVTVWVEQ